MKNLDIEKLERKNIYTAPPDFFSEVQDSVLKSLRESKENVPTPTIGRSRSKGWYVAAAALALIAGGTFVYNAGSGTESTLAQKSVSQDAAITPSTTIDSEEVPQPSAASENYAVLAKDLTLAENEYQKERQPEKNTVKPSGKMVMATAPRADVKMDMILDEFSAEDIAALSMNAEQDVYLDLYN